MTYSLQSSIVTAVMTFEKKMADATPGLGNKIELPTPVDTLLTCVAYIVVPRFTKPGMKARWLCLQVGNEEEISEIYLGRCHCGSM